MFWPILVLLVAASCSRTLAPGTLVRSQLLSTAPASAPARSPLTSSSGSSGSSSSSSMTAQQAFPVYTAEDLNSAFSSRTSLIYLMDNITLTSSAFPNNAPLTIGQTNNVTIAPAPNVTGPIFLDFGYYLTERVTMVNGSWLTLQNLLLVNYYFPALDSTPSSTFLPFFSVLPGALINCTAIRFQIDAGRCSSASDYAVSSNAGRLPWLESEYPSLLSWHVLDDHEVEVRSARVSQSFARINSTYTASSPGSGDIDLMTCIFACTASVNYSMTGYATTGDELLDELQQDDSRTIYIEDNITIAAGTWPSSVVIANGREVMLQSALPMLPGSPGNDSVPSQIFFETTSTILQAGFGGDLIVADLNLAFESICCSPGQPSGAWYVNQQPLAGFLFDDLLPAALTTLPVEVPNLAPTASLTLVNAQLMVEQCDSTRFPRAANSLVSLLNTSPASAGNATFNGKNNVVCNSCLFQGTSSKPASFSQANFYSTVQLTNVTLRCLSLVVITPPPALAPAPDLALAGGLEPQSQSPYPGYGAASLVSAAHRFSPRASVVIPVIVGVCAAVLSAVAALWALLQRDFQRLQATCSHLEDQSSRMSTEGLLKHHQLNGSLSLHHAAGSSHDS